MISKAKIKELINQDYTLISFILSLTAFIISISLNINVIMYISSILLFASIDVIGFYKLLVQDNTDDRIAFYRVLQTGLQLLIAFILLLNNWIISALFMLSWWFGLCDMLYYIIIKDDYRKYHDMYWLWWTPYGFYLNAINEKITHDYMEVFSILALLISLLVAVML